MILRYLLIVIVMMSAYLTVGSAIAQSDPFGVVDLVYIDSVEAGPGDNIPIRFNLRNDESIGSLSIPITYDTSILTLKSISFVGSRVDYIETKIINPSDIMQTKGHFVAAIIQILESPLQPGDGLLFTAVFSVSQVAISGTKTTIDSLFYPPGGEMLLVSSANSSEIRPEFKAGKLTVGSGNHAPVFLTPGNQTILEGDSLIINLSASDIDNDLLTFAVTSKPSASQFNDNTNGSARFVWVPEYVGPNSSDGSPFVVSFWVSDGVLSSQQQIQVNVINKNRAPGIELPAAVSLDAGRRLDLAVKATDPDFEIVTWEWESSISNATFDNNNPGLFAWQSAVTDTGQETITFIASDPYGFSDTASVTISINPATVYSIKLDTVEVYPGDQIDFSCAIENMVPVGGFNILFNVDPSAFTVLQVSNSGTRSESFEYFNSTLNDNSVPGNIRITGIADQGSGAPLLPAGQGPIASLRVRSSSDISLSGLTVPVRFQFLDAPVNIDNSMTDSAGSRIEQVEIAYNDGYIRFTDIGNVKVGDINLNGLAAEISDVIYFINHFVNPVTYPFSALQYANSDINGDNIVASISDLISLINLVSRGKSGKTLSETTTGKVEVSLRESLSGTVLSYESNVDLGGFFISFNSEDNFDLSDISSLQESMNFELHTDGSTTFAIMYSLDGNYLPAGSNDLFSINGATEIVLETIDIGSIDGENVEVALAERSASLPVEFALEQNYPNPFNPSTSISFSLPEATDVRLIVYNVLGQEVQVLIDEGHAAGSYTVTWDGRDRSGNMASSGVYFYRLETRQETLTRKMMLLK